MKTGTHPNGKPNCDVPSLGHYLRTVYEVPEKVERKVAYADKDELEQKILNAVTPGRSPRMLRSATKAQRRHEPAAVLISACANPSGRPERNQHQRASMSFRNHLCETFLTGQGCVYVPA